VDFPLKMVIFHSFLYVYQRVHFLFGQSTEPITKIWAAGGIAGRSTAEVRAFGMSMPQWESNMPGKWAFDIV
jgi:hypothetical protein